MSEALSGGGGGGWARGLGILLLLLLLLLVLASLARGLATVVPQEVVQQASPTPAMQCPAQTPSGTPVILVKLSRQKYPQTTGHIEYARTVKGKPYILTVDRVGKDQRSDEALAGYKPKSGYDRDEYPQRSP